MNLNACTKALTTASMIDSISMDSQRGKKNIRFSGVSVVWDCARWGIIGEFKPSAIQQWNKEEKTKSEK